LTKKTDGKICKPSASSEFSLQKDFLAFHQNFQSKANFNLLSARQNVLILKRKKIGAKKFVICGTNFEIKTKNTFLRLTICKKYCSKVMPFKI